MTIVEKLAAANGGRLLLREAHPHGLAAFLEFPRVPKSGPDATGQVAPHA